MVAIAVNARSHRRLSYRSWCIQSHDAPSMIAELVVLHRQLHHRPRGSFLDRKSYLTRYFDQSHFIMAILSLLSATLGMINIMAAASTTSVPYNIIKADICTESGCSAPYPTSGELATYGSSSIASIAAGPPRTITAQGQYVDCSGKPQSWDGTYHHTSFCLSWNTITSGKPARSGIADTVTITETTVAQGSQNGVPYGVLTSILSAATTPSNAPITSSAFSSVTTTGYSQITSSATPTPFTPDTSDTSLQQCLHNPGGLQADGHVSPGCGNMLQHIMDCYDQQAPWTDPYNGTQSTGFQSCLCQTDSHTTFSPTSALWRNFTGCSHCLLTFVPVSFHRLSIEIQRIENFCCSQNPVAYLFLLRLQGWLGGLHDGTHLEQPPLTGEITNIGALGAKFTIMLPLANVAYGKYEGENLRMWRTFH